MSSTIERKLAAIMFTDIAGYTSQMSNDQDIALSMLDAKRKALKPLIQKHHGTLVKEMGDGTLSHFSSAIDATNCSLDLQKSLKNNNDLNIRIGVHLGDTSFKDNDVFGDGVNIASRLEKMSPPGGVLVSKNVYDELSSRKGYDGISLGLQSMKGVGRLVEVFGLKNEYLNVPKISDYSDTKVDAHKDKEVPSIAIIPFDNKGSEEDAFYAYGISADLISDVSSAGLIRVASKKQIDEAGKLPQDKLAKKLNVRYMANGELWRRDDMFQLSVELYDTKDKKVLWSDRWQEKWDNLATIKGNLSDGLLKALNTKEKVRQKKVITINPEAYEIYLIAKHKYNNRKNTVDTEIVQGLLNKSIQLDNNLIKAKILLGDTYSDIGDYNRTMNIYTQAFKQAKELGDKRVMADSLNNIGLVHSHKGHYEEARDYLERSLEIRKELDDKRWMGDSLNNIGIVYADKGYYEQALSYYKKSLAIYDELGYKTVYFRGNIINNIGNVFADKGDNEQALDYLDRSLAIFKKIGDKCGMAMSLNNIGLVHWDKGDYEQVLHYLEWSLPIHKELGDKHGIGLCLNNIGLAHVDKGNNEQALDYLERSLAIRKEIGDKDGIGGTLHNIGNVHNLKGEYEQALDYLERSLAIKKEIKLKSDYLLVTTTCLYLSYKHLGKDYDVKEIHALIKEASNIGPKLNFNLYELLEDGSYLKIAYKQVQEKASAMEEQLAKKLLSYPYSKTIIEEYNKVFLK